MEITINISRETLRVLDVPEWCENVFMLHVHDAVIKYFPNADVGIQVTERADAVFPPGFECMELSLGELLAEARKHMRVTYRYTESLSGSSPHEVEIEYEDVCCNVKLEEDLRLLSRQRPFQGLWAGAGHVASKCHTDKSVQCVFYVRFRFPYADMAEDFRCAALNLLDQPGYKPET